MIAGALALAGCLVLGGAADKILSGDLAQIAPEFAALDPAVPLAPAPLAGAVRWFRTPELRRMAARLGINAPEKGICVERKTAALDAERIRGALERTRPGARIEVLDFSRVEAPEGQLEFPAAGYRRSGGETVWSGFVRYAGNRRFPVWARVKVAIPSTRVIAVAALQPGRAIETTDIRVEEWEAPLGAEGYASGAEMVAGYAVRRTVRPGEAIRKEWLEPPNVIARGDAVRVEARAGAARLELEGRAEAAGARGQIIPVSNPDSKRRFLARVEDKGRVSVGQVNP